jgi:hypothetical protein
MLDGDQLHAFRTRGCVRVPGFVPAAVAAGAAERVWVWLAPRGIDRHDPGTWPPGRPAKLQGLGAPKVYRPFADALDPYADQILGTGHWSALNGPGPLISFPESGPWRLPHRQWHLDMPARGPSDPPIALRLLGLVEPVAPRAGGTLLVEGSHELIRRMVADAGGDAGGSADIRKRLTRKHDWFRRLQGTDGDREELFEGAVIDGVRVRISETVGDAGDAYLVHPWLMHGLAPHSGAGIRSMLSHTVFRAGC